MIDFNEGDFGHTYNCCQDASPYKVVRLVSVDGNKAVVAAPVDFKATKSIMMGEGLGEDDVDVTGVCGEEVLFIRDENLNCWRTEFSHRKGKKIRKNTNPRDLEYSVLCEGFYSYRNPHI